LLANLAKVLDLEGQPERAADVRREANQDAGRTVAPAVANAPPATTETSVTVALPAPAAAAPVSASASVTVALPPPTAGSANQPIIVQATDRNGPWLERLSTGEVALVTTRQRQSSPRAPAGTTVTAALHWAPLSQPEMAPKVRVLNAARANGLAASARAMLIDRGWRNIAIGSAASVRQSSVIVYPRSQNRIARRLAVQLGIRSRMIGGKSVVVILGRDKVGAVQSQRRA
jgi:hypothetical protein